MDRNSIIPFLENIAKDLRVKYGELVIKPYGSNSIGTDVFDTLKGFELTKVQKKEVNIRGLKGLLGKTEIVEDKPHGQFFVFWSKGGSLTGGSGPLMVDATHSKYFYELSEKLQEMDKPGNPFELIE